jgi:L-aspartate oxidase
MTVRRSADPEDQVRAQVTIVGGGIAGAWLGYRLVQQGIDTVLIAAAEAHTRPVSQLAASVLYQPVLADAAAAARTGALDDATTTRPPGYQSLVEEFLADEFAELQRLVPYMPSNDVLIPRHEVPQPRLGAGGEVLSTVLGRFAELGGRTLRARVTDLVIDGDTCRGLRFVSGGVPGSVLSGAVVIASGGVSGLFGDEGTGNPGLLLGTCARAGAVLDNMEIFKRFALGDLTHRRPLYPFDLAGARFCRAGKPAEELAELVRTTPPRQADYDAWRLYWVKNLTTPHTAELADGEVRLGPIRGFTGGGLPFRSEDLGLRGLYATGEAGHSVVANCIAGLPWASYLALGGRLSAQLAEAGPADVAVTLPEAPIDRTGPVDPALRTEVAAKLRSCHDGRFTIEAAEQVVTWCRAERRHRSESSSGEDIDLLILAETCVQAALARTDSRGFFFRPDRPEPDRTLDHRWTRAKYDADADEVEVHFVDRVDGPAMRVEQDVRPAATVGSEGAQV